MAGSRLARVTRPTGLVLWLAVVGHRLPRLPVHRVATDPRRIGPACPRHPGADGCRDDGTVSERVRRASSARRAVRLRARAHRGAVNYRKADLAPRQRAMLDFAMKVALRSAEIDEGDYDALRPHGLTEQDIWDIGAIASLFAMSNRLADLMGLQPNEEFYLMGRAPKRRD